MSRYKIYIIIFLIAICIIIAFIIGFHNCQKPAPSPEATLNLTSTTSKEAYIAQPPRAPLNLIARPVSSNTIDLQWLDNSNDEDGFRIYRDNGVITIVDKNVSLYKDTGLKPGTDYQYAVKAFNQAGESSASSYTVKTPNLPITISLDRIGVYDNREDWTRGEDGEVYIYVTVIDGKNAAQKLRFPRPESQYYKLAKNETININSVIFSTDEVGNNLTVLIIGYEDDGGKFEPYVYKALDFAVEAQLAGNVGRLIDLFDLNLEGLIGQFLGKEDDYLGSFEKTWNSSNNWGIGGYTDIACTDERGTQCLRLWFSITSP